MKRAFVLLAAAAAFGASACDGNSGGQSAANSNAPIDAVAPPEGGDWTKMVTQTAEGAFVMGNPNADVKLIEFASMTCPHCAEFDEKGAEPLIEKYVKTGRVSYELRNFVTNPLDMAASLIARCNGAQGFFPLTSGLFHSQQEWAQRASNMSPEQQQALEAQPPQQQIAAVADAAGLIQWAAQRGVPSAKARQCLTSQQEAERLVQMRTDADSQFQVPGTPSFALNGELLENASTWETLEPKIRDALGG